HYEMSVNGARVGTGLLTPGWTAYDKTCLYDTHDVTHSVRAGDNAVGMVLGSGMYSVQPGRYVKFTSTFRPLAAIAQIRLEYADGSVDRGSSGGGEAFWSYTLAGRGEGESWFPRFFYHGSRYVQVERSAPPGGAPPQVESLESVVVHSDSPPAGEFACSSELF